MTSQELLDAVIEAHPDLDHVEAEARLGDQIYHLIFWTSRKVNIRLTCAFYHANSGWFYLTSARAAWISCERPPSALQRESFAVSAEVFVKVFQRTDWELQPDRVSRFMDKYPDAPVNDNCLFDMACPECGNREELLVKASATFVLEDDGTELKGGDTDWDDSSWCQCPRCSYTNDAKAFTFTNLDNFLDHHRREESRKRSEEEEQPKEP